MSDCFYKLSHETQTKKKKTFYEITHIIISGHALPDKFIKKLPCADKNKLYHDEVKLAVARCGSSEKNC